jgi:hypothetical protein
MNVTMLLSWNIEPICMGIVRAMRLFLETTITIINEQDICIPCATVIEGYSHAYNLSSWPILGLGILEPAST